MMYILLGGTEHHPNIHSLIRDGKKIELTILENRILLYFLQNVGKEITREELMEVVWGYSSNVNTRTLDMHVVRLRKKIETNPDKPHFYRQSGDWDINLLIPKRNKFVYIKVDC